MFAEKVTIWAEAVPAPVNQRFDQFMEKNGYARSEFDSFVYFKDLKDGEVVYLLLYVDDILIASRNRQHIMELKVLLSSEFEMKDLGEAKKILGMEIHRDRAKGVLTISQEGYILKVMGNFGMELAKSVGTPMGTHFMLRAATDIELRDQAEAMKRVSYQSAVGSLMYSMICTRPDMAFAVGLVPIHE